MLQWAGYGLAVTLLVLSGIEVLAPPQATPARIFVTTLWWSLGAAIVSIVLVDRWIHAPTAEGGLWVAFSSTSTFATLLILFGALHAPYSRVALVGSYVVVTAWLLIGVRRHMRSERLRLGVPEADVLDMLVAARDAMHGVRLTHVEAEFIAGESLEALRGVDGVVIDRYRSKSASLQRMITQLKLLGIRIYSTDHVHELTTGRVALDHVEDSFLDDSSGRVLYGLIKHALDVASALVLLALLGVPMLVIAGAIRLIDRESALFRQQRVGRGGRVFEMIKFRTMRGSPSVLPITADSRTMMDDAEARATPLGRWLRRFRLDELPQLFNVLAGSMSLIGPRPEWVTTATEFFERIPHYPYRHLVRPGITGWAQVNQGHVTALPDAMIKLEFDLYYVKHMSFALDLVVGVRTLRTIVTGHGAR